MKKIMVFARESEFLKAMDALDKLRCEYDIVAPPPEYEFVAVPCIIMPNESYKALMSCFDNGFVFSGVTDDYLEDEPNNIEATEDYKDVFGKAVIMYCSPCFANEKKIRIIAHISNDIDTLMPYLNTHLKNCFYNDENKTITYMDNHRMVSLYKNKIAAAKCDHILDAWRILNKIRNTVNFVNANKDSITPSVAMRKKPPVFEIFGVLPKTNCGLCGEKSCMAFAALLQSGTAKPKSCTPIFKGEYTHLQEKYFEMCSNLGLDIFS